MAPGSRASGSRTTSPAHGKHVLFGGYGRYFDRVIYNSGLDERFRLQYAVRSFQFSPTARRATASPRMVWDPAYQSKAGLDGLIAAGIAPAPEVFLIDNDTRPPVSDQFNAGIRTTSRGDPLSANYAGIRGRNGLTFVFGNRRADGTLLPAIPGFSNILISDDAKKNWFDALYLTADRPFDGRWGMRVAYTLGKAEAIGGDLFSLDYRTVEDYPRHPSPTDERHRLVVTGIVGLPYDFIVSAFVTLSSGLGYTIDDSSRGSGIDPAPVVSVRRPSARHFQLQERRFPDRKIFRLAQQSASIAFEGFNIFNSTNFGCYNGTIPVAPVNPNFGVPSCTVDNSSRRLQFGVRYTF